MIVHWPDSHWSGTHGWLVRNDREMVTVMQRRKCESTAVLVFSIPIKTAEEKAPQIEMPKSRNGHAYAIYWAPTYELDMFLAYRCTLANVILRRHTHLHHGQQPRVSSCATIATRFHSPVP